MSVSTTLKRVGLEQAFHYLYKDPEKNLRHIMDWADKFANGEFERQRATIRDVDLTLTQSEFSLLTLISSRPGDVWTVEELYRELWGQNGPVDAQLVQGHLSRMRRKLEKAFPRHEFIETVWGKGYRFVPREDR